MSSRSWKEIFLIDLRVVEHPGDADHANMAASFPFDGTGMTRVIAHDVPIGWIVDEGKDVRFLTPSDLRASGSGTVFDELGWLQPGSVAIEGIYGAADNGFSCLGNEKAEHVNNLDQKAMTLFYHWARQTPRQLQGRENWHNPCEFRTRTLGVLARVTSTYDETSGEACVGIDILGPLVIEEATWIDS